MNVALWCLIMGVVLWLFAALIDAMSAKFLVDPPKPLQNGAPAPPSST